MAILRSTLVQYRCRKTVVSKTMRRWVAARKDGSGGPVREAQAAVAQDADADFERACADLLDEPREPEHYAEDSSAAKMAKHEDMIVQLQATIASMQEIIQNMTEELDSGADPSLNAHETGSPNTLDESSGQGAIAPHCPYCSVWRCIGVVGVCAYV